MAHSEIEYPLLCLDTSTPSCSVALFLDKSTQYSYSDNTQNSHSDILFTQVQDVLNDASLTFTDIASVVFAGGPGSYTGLRIAASAIKGWFFGLDTKIISVPTLPFVAYHAMSNAQVGQKIIAILDARRKHVYTQTYLKTDKGLLISGKAGIEEIEHLSSHLTANDILVGTGIPRFSDSLSAIKFPISTFDARFLHQIVISDIDKLFWDILPIDEFEPDYMGTPV